MVELADALDEAAAVGLGMGRTETLAVVEVVARELVLEDCGLAAG